MCKIVSGQCAEVHHRDIIQDVAVNSKNKEKACNHTFKIIRACMQIY